MRKFGFLICKTYICYTSFALILLQISQDTKNMENTTLRLNRIFFHSIQKKTISLLGIFALIFFSHISIFGQTFPNPATLSTGQGAPNTIDPLWLASPWYASNPPNPMGLTYISTLINNNCAPGAWVDPTTLPAPVNNGNWITGSDGNCATNTNSGYRYFRLTLNLPADCNGFSVTVAGNYVLDLIGYADNTISDVFINGNSTGISGGNYAAGGQLNINLQGPWVVGTNYVDILVFNSPSANPGDQNPYGLLLVANATTSAGMDTDNDGVSNLDDLCPCEAGTNPYGCTDPSLYNCDIDAIRQAFVTAGCIEMPGCSSDCSIYFLNPQQMTGSQAQAFAQNLGANLVSIQSQDENDCILSSLSTLNQTGVIWIGFSDEVTEGSFVWYDQSPIVYTNWAPGEPNQSGNEDCVQIYPTGANPGTWNDLSCSSSNSKSIIEVNLCPVINAGNDVSICTGSSTTLNASNTLFGSSPYTYEWSNGPIIQSNPVSPTDTTAYIIVTTDRYDCTTSDTVVVNVMDLPVVSAGPDVVVCPEETVTLSGSGDVTNTYAWNNGITNATAFTPFAQSTNYIVTGTNANNCVNSDTVNVSVQLDGCPNFPNDFTCDIEAIRAAFTAAGCVEMVGCVSECSIYFLNQQALSGSAAQAFAQNLGANLVSIQSQDENDCIVSSLVNLGLNTAADVIWIGYNDETTEGTFAWYDQSPITYTNWASGEPNNSGGDEDCVQIYPNGGWNDLPCGIGNARSIIEVNLCPVMNAGADQIICLGETVNLDAGNTILGSSPYTYAWNTGAQTQSTTVNPTQTSDYSVASTDRYGCTTADTLTVTVNSVPNASFQANNVCVGTTMNFNNQSTVSGDVITQNDWAFGDANTSTLEDPTHTYATSNSYNVTLTVTTANGCSDSQTESVTVYPIPAAPIISSNSPVQCPGDLVELGLNSTAGATYTWTGPNNYTNQSQNISFQSTFENEGTYTAFIEVNGCPSPTASTIVSILGSFEATSGDFPNVITPNGDGTNDVLDIDQFFNPCLPYTLQIWNRWGNLVYEQEFAGVPFEGKDLGGNVLTDGVYFYRLKYGENDQKGFITIVR